MELMGYYLLFAFSAALTACYSWFWPAVQKAKKLNINNALTTSPILGVLVFIVITTLVAPFIVLPLLVPSMGDSFAAGLERELLKPD